MYPAHGPLLHCHFLLSKQEETCHPWAMAWPRPHSLAASHSPQSGGACSVRSGLWLGFCQDFLSTEALGRDKGVDQPPAGSWCPNYLLGCSLTHMLGVQVDSSARLRKPSTVPQDKTKTFLTSSHGVVSPSSSNTTPSPARVSPKCPSLNNLRASAYDALTGSTPPPHAYPNG